MRLMRLETQKTSNPNETAQSEPTLDPADWEAFGLQAHHMLDDILGYLQTIQARPVWQPTPAEVRVPVFARRFLSSLRSWKTSTENS